MSDPRADQPVFLTVKVGNDDLARVLKLPGTHPDIHDGGKTYEGNIHLQRGMSTAGLNLNIFTSHWDQARHQTLSERDAYASWELSAGRGFTKTLNHGTSLFAYAQGNASYQDTRLAPVLHNAVHAMIGGRNMTPIYQASHVKDGIAAGVDGVIEARRDMRLGGLEIKPSLFAAASAGTDRSEGALGVRLPIGHRVDGTARALPTANPEASGTTFVQAPDAFAKGNWSLTPSYSKTAYGDNRYLRAGEPERKTVERLAVEAVYNIASNVSINASWEKTTNPVQPGPQRAGPPDNTSFKLGATVRF